MLVQTPSIKNGWACVISSNNLNFQDINLLWRFLFLVGTYWTFRNIDIWQKPQKCIFDLETVEALNCIKCHFLHSIALVPTKQRCLYPYEQGEIFASAYISIDKKSKLMWPITITNVTTMWCHYFSLSVLCWPKAEITPTVTRTVSATSCLLPHSSFVF